MQVLSPVTLPPPNRAAEALRARPSIGPVDADRSAKGGGTTGGAVHLVRPGRPAVVTRTLTELAGPTRGVVELPVRLMWATERSFDLADPDDLLWMYENVLRETTRVDDLRRLVHGRTLRRVWPLLNLPRGVRQAWESRHRGLRSG